MPPKKNDAINKIMKMKNRIFAIQALSAAIPENPKIAAAIATSKKITAQFSNIVTP
jgi:hypothetical protein